MHKYLLAIGLAALSFQAMASCDKLKQEIDGRLQAKGLAGYTLEIVPATTAAAATPAAAAPAVAAPASSSAPAAAAPAVAHPAAAAAPAAAAPAAAHPASAGKVVGNCDGGTKQIIYHRAGK